MYSLQLSSETQLISVVNNYRQWFWISHRWGEEAINCWDVATAQHVQLGRVAFNSQRACAKVLITRFYKYTSHVIDTAFLLASTT